MLIGPAADALGPDEFVGLTLAAGDHQPQQMVGAGRGRVDGSPSAVSTSPPTAQVAVPKAAS